MNAQSMEVCQRCQFHTKAFAEEIFAILTDVQKAAVMERWEARIAQIPPISPGDED